MPEFLEAEVVPVFWLLRRPCLAEAEVVSFPRPQVAVESVDQNRWEAVEPSSMVEV